MSQHSNSNVIGDRMTYLVIESHSGGSYSPEQPLSAMDRRSVVKSIAQGQHESVIQVLELNPVEGICRDVLEDLAWEVSALWASDGDALNSWQMDFIEQTLGLEAANAFREAA